MTFTENQLTIGVESFDRQRTTKVIHFDEQCTIKCILIKIRNFNDSFTEQDAN